MALSLPTDLLVAKTEGRRESVHDEPPGCDPRLIDEAAGLLRAAKRPLIVAGGGAISAGASAELAALAHRLGAPVVTSVMGRGSIPETDPLWLGVLPNYRSTQAALEIADVIANNGPLAVQAILRSIRETEGLPENDAFKIDTKLGISVFLSEDAKEGPLAFKEKRAPQFKNR